MALTVTANIMTVSHKGSIGLSIAFPDVCKTPTPAGPIPIPYPNIAMSVDTTDGSSTVKMDKKEIMIKGANMKMSTGDEAGSAQGVVSSKIKGKAEFVNYSFDVKVDGENVCRLLDPTKGNMGSANTMAPVHAQAPLAPGNYQRNACNRTKKKHDTEAGPETSWGNSGVVEKHQGPIQQVVETEKIIIYFRASNDLCKKWINDDHHPKPHSVLAGNTTKPHMVPEIAKWLVEYWQDPVAFEALEKNPIPIFFSPTDASDYEGVVMSTASISRGKPLRGFGKSFCGERSYEGKWITGDYDLTDVLFCGDKCKRPDKFGFGKLQRLLNKAMGWDGIQHPPQQAWNAKEDQGLDPEFRTFDVGELTSEWLNSQRNTPPPSRPIAEGRAPLPMIDTKLTVVSPNGCVIYLESSEDVHDAMTCCGCGRK